MVQVWGASIRSWRYGWLKKKRSMHRYVQIQKRWCPSSSSRSVGAFITPMSLWFLLVIYRTGIYGVYKPINITFGGTTLLRSHLAGGEKDGKSVMNILWSIPDAPCMVYLPTFGWFLGHMLVNIPYMEHMGMGIPIHRYQKWPLTKDVHEGGQAIFLYFSDQ